MRSLISVSLLGATVPHYLLVIALVSRLPVYFWHSAFVQCVPMAVEVISSPPWRCSNVMHLQRPPNSQPSDYDQLTSQRHVAARSWHVLHAPSDDVNVSAQAKMRVLSQPLTVASCNRWLGPAWSLSQPVVANRTRILAKLFIAAQTLWS